MHAFLRERFSRSRTCLIVAAAAALMSLAARASATDAATLIEPRVDHAQFNELILGLQLDDDQEVIAEMMFSSYSDSLDDLARKLDDRADAASRERVEDALAGRIYINPQELRDLRVGLLKIQQECWSEADRLFDQLLGDVTSLLIDSQPRDDRAFMKLRRQVFLHPRQEAEMDEAYAGEGVDVAQLVEPAAGPVSELEHVDPGFLDSMLMDYEGLLDRYLRANSTADRAGRLVQAVARIERDQTALVRAQQQHVARWRELYQLNLQTVNQIGEVVAREAGPAARERWLERFDQASFPWLMTPAMPEREYEWIVQRAPRPEADAVIADFRPRFRALRRDAAAIIVRGRMTYQIMLRSGMDPSTLDRSEVRDLYQEVLRNSGQRSTLVAETSTALQSLLDESQRRQMKSDIAAAAYGKRR